jgi:hypothetical protein
MSDYLKDLEYYSSSHNCYVYGNIIGIKDNDNYIIKNIKDGKEEICDSHSIRKVINISKESQEKGIWEYIKGEDELLEVTIKEQKGLFYIIELTDEEGNTSTKLARQKELRCINYIPFKDLIEDKYANIFFDIPSELSSWIDSEKYNEIIKDIQEKTSKDSESPEIFIISYPDEEPSSIRVFCNADKKDFIDLYLCTAINGEKELTSVNKDKENSKKELEDVKKKNKTFFIPQKFAGLIIGKDGINIKNLKSKYGVNITIDSKKVNEKNLAKVIITGSNGEKVEECSKEIDVVQKIFEISENCATDIKKRANSLMETYKIKMIYVSFEEKKDDNEQIYKAPNVECIGNEEYIDKFYNKEIKGFVEYNYGGSYSNYSSGSSFKQNNRKYNNNYYGYQNKYKHYKGYNTYNNYY